jgi:hypothetical protein
MKVRGAGSSARSGRVGLISANGADRLGRGRARGSIPHGIESVARVIAWGWLGRLESWLVRVMDQWIHHLR